MVSQTAASSRVRVQLDMAAEEAAALDELRDRCALRSRADAVRLALAVLHWTAEQSQEGRRVLAVGKRDVVQLAVPGITRRQGEKEVGRDGRGGQ